MMRRPMKVKMIPGEQVFRENGQKNPPLVERSSVSKAQLT
jgi:hypothetical protein